MGAASKRIRVRSTGPKEGGSRMAQFEAYCVKEKAKRTFEGEVVTMKNGRKAARGKCPSCGITLNRILGKEEAERLSA
jgi:ribosomal protein L34E